ncbi:MAG: orotidine-5'-phosphate decarboxylase [Coriobacteriia bacterium]|nr:orotidine-5'-phosphate decarboxylase [Coriobacteriia bacterium]
MKQQVKQANDARDRLIVALDGSREQALCWARELAGSARWVKVGMTLFYQTGPAIIEEMKALGYQVFLDLKLHDIPHQVEGAARTLGSLGVDLLTVHSFGGRPMMEAAMQGAHAGAAAAGHAAPKVVAVTVLTSMSDTDLHDISVVLPAAIQVERLATLARAAGTDGIVCSPHEAAPSRTLLGPDAWIVTPGVRPGRSAADDQSRIATPTQALAAGASHLVVGRPITGSPDRLQAFSDLLSDLGVEGV